VAEAWVESHKDASVEKEKNGRAIKETGNLVQFIRSSIKYFRLIPTLMMWTKLAALFHHESDYLDLPGHEIVV
jgi:hypothetical protein